MKRRALALFTTTVFTVMFTLATPVFALPKLGWGSSIICMPGDTGG